MLAALVGAAPNACRRAEAPPLLDLAREVAVATCDSRLEIVMFGSIAAEAHELSGFAWNAAAAGEDGGAWAEPRAEILFEWPAPRPRTLVLDLAPLPELASQAVAVEANGVAVGRVALGRGRARHAFFLPAEAQRAGRNVVALLFDQGSTPQKHLHRRVAAIAYGYVAGPAEDPALAGYAKPGAPPALAAETVDGVTRLVQASPSTLRYAFAAPDDAVLRFTPALHDRSRTPGARVRLSVTLETDGQPARTLWAQTMDAGTRGREIALPLGLPGGTPARIGLAVDADGPTAWATWRAPCLTGRGRLDPLRAQPQVAAAVGERARALASSLAGCNVVMIVLDAAGARHFSAYGYGRPTTPAIARLASEGALFEEAYSPVGFTVLAMSSVWTSEYPEEHHNGVPYNARLDDQAQTLAETLAARGVHTAAFVDNASAGPAFGLDQGFGDMDELYLRGPHGAEIFPRLAGAWIEQHRGDRFFAYLHFREPHFPYTPPPPYDTLFGPEGPLARARRGEIEWFTAVNWKRASISDAQVEHLGRLYDGNLRYADEQIAALRRRLEAAGVWERTVVLVTADHGEALHEHDFIGHQQQLYADVVHVPLVVRWPKGRGPAGVRVRALVDLLDIAPTIAEIFGAPRPAGFRGRSLLPVVLGAPGKDAVVARSAEEQPKYALRHDRYHYIYHSARGEDELYDLAADPAETRDLSDGAPVRSDWYRQTLHRWIADERRLPRAAARTATLSADQQENLRSLGYVQ